MANSKQTRDTRTPEEKRVDNAIASSALEGLITPPEERELLIKLAEGKVSFEYVRRYAKQKYIKRRST